MELIGAYFLTPNGDVILIDLNNIHFINDLHLLHLVFRYHENTRTVVDVTATGSARLSRNNTSALNLNRKLDFVRLWPATNTQVAIIAEVFHLALIVSQPGQVLITCNTGDQAFQFVIEIQQAPPIIEAPPAIEAPFDFGFPPSPPLEDHDFDLDFDPEFELGWNLLAHE
eukprot:TRINITY_DN4508_c2_g1_i1.p1 TRINITY_DN4508_c2_g1~~TRINITY_DN4508_c2_g1_i1.p1  ORF type:complete len:198 (+),score=73.10 TRINITY_DN4508_c2_g1_i1:86-595(+)